MYFYCPQTLLGTQNQWVEQHYKVWSVKSLNSHQSPCLQFLLCFLPIFVALHLRQNARLPILSLPIHMWLLFLPYFRRTRCRQGGRCKYGAISLEPLTLPFCFILHSFWMSSFLCLYFFFFQVFLSIASNNVISNTSFLFTPLWRN